MANLSFIIGIVGNVISILVFSSPIATFKRIVKKKSTESFKWLPYTTTLLSTSLWTFYGLLKPGGLLVVTVNGAGTILQAIYVTLYLIYAPKETRVKIAKVLALLNIGFYGAVILITLLVIHGKTRLLVVGFLCAALTVGMYASPLAAMGMVVKTKSVEYMPFFLSFFLFLNGGAWTIYSVLVRDFFIGVPNAIGLVLGSAQLIVYCIYMKHAPLALKAKGMDQVERSTHVIDGEVEMQRKWESGEDKSVQERNLSKGRSLPKPSVSRQYSFPKFVKSLSLSSYELHAYWHQSDRVPQI